MKNKKKNKIDIDLKVLLKYFKGTKFLLFICFVGFISAGTAYIFVGKGVANSIKFVTAGNKEQAINVLILTFILENIINFVFNIIFFILSKIELKVSYKISYDAYRKSLNLPAYVYEQISSGEVINRITNDSNSIVNNTQKALEIITEVISDVIIFIYLTIMNVYLGIYIFIFMFFYLFMLKKFSKKLKEKHERRKKATDELSSITNESIRGIREIKSLGIYKNIVSKVEKIVNKLIEVSSDEIIYNRNYSIIFYSITDVFEIGIYILASILAYYGMLDVSFVLAIAYFIYRFVYLFQCVETTNIAIQELSVAFNRIGELLFNKKYKDVPFGYIELNDIKGEIKFNNATFGYPKEKNILNNFSVKFEPNKKIAIVGASGGGKTSLFNLLTRIFDLKKGTITIDGINIKDISEDSLRKNISVVRQEPFVFNKTIYENFKMIDENITLKEVRYYCKKAYLDDYIMSLPKKYNTLLGEGGVNLSGGQKQRLSIARTLSKNSKIILFDEATSALDNESQEYVKKSINDLVNDHTIIIIAHRLSTIIDADIIYVVKDGKIHAIGNHDELIKNCDYYNKMYNKES